VLRVVAATGTVDYGPTPPANGPDGVERDSSFTAPSIDGLAGPTLARGRALLAVFLPFDEPMDPASASFDATDAAFTQIEPASRQIFFIGDGLTGEGTGEVQRVDIPAGATRVALGFYDALNAGDDPGYYSDNSGSVEMTRSWPTSRAVDRQLPPRPGLEAGRSWHASP
jgi:hypothetical protein